MLKHYRFPLLFLAIYAVLQVLYLSGPDWLVRDVLVDQLTVVPAAHLINAVWPQAQVVADQSSIRSAAGSLNVLRGCEGTETLLMLLAAVIAARRSLGWSLSGALIGCALVYGLNQLRILGLYWVVVNRHDWFALAHGYIAPLLVVALSLVFFVLWSRAGLPPQSNRNDGDAGASPA